MSTVYVWLFSLTTVSLAVVLEDTSTKYVNTTVAPVDGVMLPAVEPVASRVQLNDEPPDAVKVTLSPTVLTVPDMGETVTTDDVCFTYASPVPVDAVELLVELES